MPRSLRLVSTKINPPKVRPLHPIARRLKLSMLASGLALSARAGGMTESREAGPEFAPITLVALGDMPYRA